MTTLQPKNADAWFQLAQAAQTSGDTATTIKAYKQYLVLNSRVERRAIRQLIQQLAPAPAPQPKKKK